MPIPYEWKDKIDGWVNKMGYHYVIDYISCPEKTTVGSSLNIELCVDNVGIAPIYKKLPFNIRLKSERDEYIFTTEIDIRAWLPGKNTEKIEINLPKGLTPNVYALEVGIISNMFPVIYFATDAERDGAYYKLNNIEII